MTDSVETSFNQRCWALIIGIDRYKNNALPPLETAERGARELARVLHEDMGYPKNHIVMLTNQEATRDAILSWLVDYFTDPRTILENDRLLIYYAGHGLTRTPTNGGPKVGYIAPYDAESGRWSTCIEMDVLDRQASFMPAKHVLFLLDACFSGLALTRYGRQVGFDPLQDMLNRPSRRVITAGSEDQPTSDRLSQEKYSAFTYFLLDGLRGNAMREGVLRAAHLGIYIQDQVRKHSIGRQTPQLGHMLGDKGGDFVFRIATHARLEVWMQQALISASPQERLKAAYELWETAENSADDEMITFAIQTLETMQFDGDEFVRDSVRYVLQKLAKRGKVIHAIEPAPPQKPSHEMTTQLNLRIQAPADSDESADETIPHREQGIYPTQTVSNRERQRLVDVSIGAAFSEAPTLLDKPNNFEARLDESRRENKRRFGLF